MRKTAFVALVAVALVAATVLAPAELGLPGPTLSSLAGDFTALLPALADSASVARDLGPLHQSGMVVGVSLAMPDPGAADAYVYSMSTPGSPYYGHTMTAQQWRSLFAPSVQQYSQVVDYYQAMGLRPLTTPDRLMVGFEGTAPQIETAFHTSLHRYTLVDGRDIFGPSQPVYVPSGLGIDALTGFTNLTGPVPEKVNPAFLQSLSHPAPATSASPHGTWTCTNGTWQPCDEPGYYNEYPLFRQGDTGKGVTVGIVDAYDSGENQTSLAASLRAFASGGGYPTPNEKFLYPIPTTYNLNTSVTSGWGGETDLDQAMVDMTAPGATIDVTFASDQSFAVYEAVDYLVAHNVSQVISMSWGEPDVGTMQVAPQNPCLAYYSCNASWDGSYAFLHPVFAEAAAIGITPFAAAGDCGASDGTAVYSTDYPASDPFVVAVGGTSPNSTGQTYQGETGWEGGTSGGASFNCSSNTGPGGGGYAPFAQPWWQHGPGQLTKGLRGVPDVSADASDGTSQATPMWAGWTAVADQIHGGGLGLLGPSLYSLLRNSTAYKADFHDITIGNNGYSAGPGWDPMTGIGSPNVSMLLPALAGHRPPPVSSLRASLVANVIPGGKGLNVSLVGNATGGTPPYSYDFVPGLYLGQWTGSRSVLNFTYPGPGVYTAMVTVFDNASNSSTSLPVVVNLGGKNLSVSLTESSSLVGVNWPLTFQTNVSGGTPPYHFTYYYGDNTYGYNGTSSNVHAYGTTGIFCPEVIVTDAAKSTDSGSADGTCLTVSTFAGPPLAITGFNATPSSILLGGKTAFAVNATGGVPPYNYSYSGLPPGCLNVNASLLNCTPTAAGNYTVHVTITDTHHATIGANALLSVRSPPSPLLIHSFTVSSSSDVVNRSVTVAAQVQGGLGPYTFVYSGLPTGCLSVNSSSFSCIPKVTGNYVLHLTVTDSQGKHANATCNLTVVPVAPTIQSFTVHPSPVNVSANITITVRTSGGEAPLTYHYTGLPSRCVVQDLPQFTCTADTIGNYTVEVTVTDALGRTATQNASLEIQGIPYCSTPSSHGCTPDTTPVNSFPGTWWEWLALIGIVVAAIVIAGVVVSRRKRNKPADGPAAPPSEINYRY